MLSATDEHSLERSSVKKLALLLPRSLQSRARMRWEWYPPIWHELDWFRTISPRGFTKLLLDKFDCSWTPKRTWLLSEGNSCVKPVELFIRAREIWILSWRWWMDFHHPPNFSARAKKVTKKGYGEDRRTSHTFEYWLGSLLINQLCRLSTFI